MNVEHLSDHVGDLVDESRHKLRLLEDERAYWSGAVRQAEEDLVVARRRRSFLRRLFNVAPLDEPRLRDDILDAERGLRSIASRVGQLENEIGAREGGAEGERRFEGELGWLSDEWTMFRGYRNQRGEADAVLVGPDGVWTVEVKNWKARIRIDGDIWMARDSRSGAERKATDRKGRSPARQVQEIAASLSNRLNQVGHDMPVRTAVVVLNRHAEIEGCRRPSVDFVGTSTGVFADRVAELASSLDPNDVAAIQQLVRDDHRYWERRTELRRASD